MIVDKSKRIPIFLISSMLLVGVLILSTWILEQNKTNNWFIGMALPLTEIHRFFDIGVVDANGDDNLDIFTSNHHFRQSLLISDGKGNFKDVLTDWKLDQSLTFPNAELSFTAPDSDKPGLYIYWLGTQFIIKTHQAGSIGSISGTLRVYDPIEIMKNDGFVVNKEQRQLEKNGSGTVSETILNFSSDSEAFLRMRPGGQGLPINFILKDTLRPDQIFVGLGKVSPAKLDFSLAMKDRHALAWADYDRDGNKDIFINRGALSGTLRNYPKHIREALQDELLIKRADGTFENIASIAGLAKDDCSGRHARWLDFNGDGLLDLYVNCYNREHAYGEFPKQLYIQQSNGQLRNMASKTGAAMPAQQIGSFVWTDADDDGDVDLVTLQNEGFYLYRNNSGILSQEAIYERPLSGVQIGNTTEGAWVYDGKLTASDYDRDGDVDLFASSKRGNVLLRNQSGHFTHLSPASVGLPETSFNASWIDYDNDGLPDLHMVPQGIYRQNQANRFEATGILELPNEQYQAAVSNWFDLDNDGRLDLVMALNENPAFRHWWEFSPTRRLSTIWPLHGYRHKGPSGHWLQIRLVGGEGNREAIGAKVTTITSNGTQTQEVGNSEGAFFSQGHYRLYFGMGGFTKADKIVVRWSDGFQQEHLNVDADKLHVIERVTAAISGNLKAGK